MSYLLKKYFSLLRSDEIFFCAPNESFIFNFKGSSLEMINEIKSINHLAIFSKPLSETVELVDLNKIIWTDHPSYQQFWNLDGHSFQPQTFVGKREPSLDGVYNRWLPRLGFDDKFIILKKHPELNLYCISGDGNNRIMKSLITMDRPIDVYAKVISTEWNSTASFLINFFKQNDFNIVDLHISNRLTIGLKEFKYSKLFYLTLDPKSIPSMNQILKSIEIRKNISNWNYLSISLKVGVIIKIIHHCFKRESKYPC